MSGWTGSACLHLEHLTINADNAVEVLMNSSELSFDTIKNVIATNPSIYDMLSEDTLSELTKTQRNELKLIGT
ncbi:MAG: hypothetical protein DRG78_00245 [Epsilonproteobacteria bacterium]|nr:MAG: hypothetical protein DRG78_00245 [Campylobacterota bacterium]